MLLSWLTLITSTKTLMNLAMKVVFAITFYYLSQEDKQQLSHTQFPIAGFDEHPVTSAEKISSMSESDFTLTSTHTSKNIPMPNSITGVYTYYKTENFDNYLKELGVPYLLRSFAGLATPVVTISKDCPQNEECIWTIKTETLFKNHQVKFKLGEWSNDVTMDGRSVTFKIEQESPNRLVEIQKSGDKTTTLIRDFSQDRMDVKLSVNDVISTSVFLRSLPEDKIDLSSSFPDFKKK